VDEPIVQSLANLAGVPISDATASSQIRLDQKLSLSRRVSTASLASKPDPHG
jgi:hypothetical protein